LMTSFVDVSRSTKVLLEIAEPLHTIQCDLSSNVKLKWNDKKVFDAAKPEGPRIYHAGCSNLSIYDGRTEEAVVGETKLSSDDEAQFLTHVLNEKLLTEKIVVAGDSSRLMGATQRDLDAEQATQAKLDAAKARKTDLERTKGNDAFKKREYAQAVAHYTMALADLTQESTKDRAVLLANRAAAFLKLGQPEKALDDATNAVDLDTTYSKAHFRKGLALHALQRYQEALPCLGTAHNIEPKNAQITDAIRFAEMRLARGANLRNPYQD